MATIPFVTADKAAKAKVAKYQEHFEEKVETFIVETTGAILPASVDSLYNLLRHAPEERNVPARIDVIKDVAAIVLKGNARAFAGWARNRRRAQAVQQRGSRGRRFSEPAG